MTSLMEGRIAVDGAFTKALPKIELHAHLTGSIDTDCLHEIWLRKRGMNECSTGTTVPATTLPDPRDTIRPEGAHQNIATFFKLFDTYIYALCNDPESVRYATKDVLRAFQADGVKYLELRTTPREVVSAGSCMSKEDYVATVLDAIAEYDGQHRQQQHDDNVMATFLILSIDRRNTLQEALDVVDLACKFHNRGVVGVDLCGNPVQGDVSTFATAFARARDAGLKITLHFAEVPASSSAHELETLLSYRPQRIGHVIHVSDAIRDEIQRRQVALELCLSCNVHAKMIRGGFEDHHFGEYYQRGRCPIILCTDDVGIFGSPLSNEYLLAAQHFGLGRKELIALSRQAIPTIFGPDVQQIRLTRVLDDFETRDSDQT